MQKRLGFLRGRVLHRDRSFCNIDRRILFIKLGEQRLYIAGMDHGVRSRQYETLTESAQLHDVAVPRVVYDGLPGMGCERMMHLILPVVVIEIKIQHILDIVRALLQLRHAKAECTEGEEEVRAEEKLVSELREVFRGRTDDADIDIAVLCEIRLAGDALRTDDAGELRLHRERQLIDALDHQCAMVTVQEGTLSSHAWIAEQDTVLILVGQTGQRDHRIGLPLSVTSVMDRLSDHLELRTGGGLDQHRTRGTGIELRLLQLRLQIDEEMLEHLEGSHGRIAMQQDDVTRLEIHKVQIPFYILLKIRKYRHCRAPVKIYRAMQI